MGSLTPQEIAKLKPEDPVKSSERLYKTVIELKKANEDFSKIAEDYDEQLRDRIEKMNEEYDTIKANTELEKDVKEVQLKKKLKELNEQLEDVRKKLETKFGLDKAKEVIVEVIINSNDRFDLLYDLFEKVGAEKFLRTQPLSEIWDALEGAKEV